MRSKYRRLARLAQSKRVYLAGDWRRKDELTAYALALQAQGLRVTARWLWTDGEDAMDDVEMRQAALQCAIDIGCCDTFLAFTDKKDAPKGRGGRHVEFGMALALGLQTHVIGPTENVFHATEGIGHFRSFGAFLEYLRTAKQTLEGLAN